MNHADEELPDGRRWRNGVLVSATDAACTDGRDISDIADAARIADDTTRIETRISKFMMEPKAPLTTRGAAPANRENAGVSRELVSESASVARTPPPADTPTVTPVYICVDGTPTLVNFLTPP